MAYKSKAKSVMNRINKKDSVFIASVLALNCDIWSDDKHFQKQEGVKIYTTEEILNTLDFND